jgi:hypothetical protein
MTDNTFTPADYTETRRRGVELHLKIFKKLTQDDIKTCAKQLGLWRNKTVQVESDEEMDLFTDYAIYAFQPHGFNMAEKYRRLFSQAADDFELAILPHMSAARYAIYQVEQTNGKDSVEATDVFSKAGYSILDHQLAKTAQTGMMLAGYLIEFEDFVIQTGGSVSITREILQADEVVKVIDQIEDDQLATFLNNPSQAAKLARAIVSATIRLGHDRHVSRTAV